MSKLTVFLARCIGLFTVLIVVAFLVRGSAMIEATVADGPVMLAYAIISLAMGVAMIVGHNVWSGGALPVVVTLVGWLSLVKGVLLVLLARSANRNVRADALWRACLPVPRPGACNWSLSDLGRLYRADPAGILGFKPLRPLTNYIARGLFPEAPRRT